MSEPNIYDCRLCGGETVTRHVVQGVTPASIECRATAGCRGEAWSRFYRVDPAVEERAEWEWWRPEGREYRKLSRAMRAHVDMGGLDLRRVQREETP